MAGSRLPAVFVLCLLGAAATLAAASSEAAPQTPPGCEEAVGRLTPIPGPLLEDHLGPTVREVLEIVWRGHNGNPHRPPRCRVEIVGQVVIASAPHEFELEARQERGVQIYELRITEYGVLDLEVKAAAGQGRFEARYSLVRSAGQSTRGTVAFDDETLPES